MDIKAELRLMREHIYRGKRLDNGEWVYGYLYRLSERLNPFIMLKNEKGLSYAVDAKTVGQYTGMDDSNNKKIFVDDMVIITYSEDGETNEEIRVVSDAGKGQGYSPLNWGEICESCDHCVEINSIKVIGNIHENPELME